MLYSKIDIETFIVWLLAALVTGIIIGYVTVQPNYSETFNQTSGIETTGGYA